MLGAVPLFAGTPSLLARLRRDLDRSGRLRVSSAAVMWGAYAGYGVLTTAAFAAPPVAPPLPPPVRAAALGLTTAGASLGVAGVRRFAGPAQLTGTAAGSLVTGGIYRCSRNPQYIGLVATLAGMSLVRRSLAGLALAAGLAGTYRAWVPIEEHHLARLFGEPYRRYCDVTPRWLGLPAGRREQAPASDGSSKKRT